MSSDHFVINVSSTCHHRLSIHSLQVQHRVIMELIPQNTTPRHTLSLHTHTPHAAGACTPEQNIHIVYWNEQHTLFIGIRT